jgi:hypothetical protein
MSTILANTGLTIPNGTINLNNGTIVLNGSTGQITGNATTATNLTAAGNKGEVYTSNGTSNPTFQPITTSIKQPTNYVNTFSSSKGSFSVDLSTYVVNGHFYLIVVNVSIYFGTLNNNLDMNNCVSMFFSDKTLPTSNIYTGNRNILTYPLIPESSVINNVNNYFINITNGLIFSGTPSVVDENDYSYLATFDIKFYDLGTLS